MTEYEGGARAKPDIICQMSSREGKGTSRSQKKRSEQYDAKDEGPESSLGTMTRKRQRSRSRDRLMKTPGLWGGHEHHRGSRNGSPRPALSSLFPCGPVLRITSSNNNAPAAPTPAQSRKTCDESASSGVKTCEESTSSGVEGETLVEGRSSFSESPREDLGDEDEEVALREKGHRMAFLSYRGISEEFLSLLDELTYEDSSDEYKRKHGRYGHDDELVLEDDDVHYFPVECPMPRGLTSKGVCGEFFAENVVRGRDETETARHGPRSELST